MAHTNIQFWIKVQKSFEKICDDMDQNWQKRKRLIDTKLLVVVIFKIILSKNKQGYGSVLRQLWDDCLGKDIKLPKDDFVAASSLCDARQKLSETIFKILNNELIDLWHKYKETPTWMGHKTFAIDGSKLNVPRGLLNYGYKISKNTTRHYPYAMMSCMYSLQEQIVYDFEMVSHNNERACAIEHLKKAAIDDLIVFDRGYFSFLLLHEIIKNQQHAVFRMQRGTCNSQISAFWKSDQLDVVVKYTPSKTVIYELKKQGWVLSSEYLQLRLIKHKIGDEIYVYATTLMDKNKYPVDCFPALYHSRWGIEELYKISKCFIDIEDFHSQTERGVKQEIYGHLLLINIARLFEFDARQIVYVSEKDADIHHKTKGFIQQLPNKPIFKINFKHCLTVVGNLVEYFVFTSKKLITTFLHKAMKSIARIKQHTRPNRHYPRVSHKPRSRWNSFGSSLF